MTPLEQYRELETKVRLLLRSSAHDEGELDRLLDHMDVLWGAMSPEERDTWRAPVDSD